MVKYRTVLLGISMVLVCTGIITISINRVLLKLIIKANMELTPDSPIFTGWKHLPEMLPMDIYLFNWTNPEEIYNVSAKPKVEQLGPYRLFIDLKKDNITWNSHNSTVTYRQKKFFYYSDDSRSLLSDRIYSLNTPAAGAGYASRFWNYWRRAALSLTLSTTSSKLYLNGTIDEFLLEGLEEPLTRLARQFGPADVPISDKFGYFYKRNGSDELEGTSNIGTGTTTPLGYLYQWNYQNRTPYFEPDCNRIGGSTGVQYQVNSKPKTIEMFLQDLCRVLILEYVGEVEIDGILGYKYIMGEQSLDNGSKFSRNKCYCRQKCLPSGVFNTSACRYGSPSFMSLPHFYQSDSYYVNSIDGLAPDKSQHEFSVIIEPNTGIPLEINARLQLNFLIQNYPGLSLFKNVPKIMFPVFWFHNRVTFPRNNLDDLKLLLRIPTISIAVGSVLLLLGLLLGIYAIVKLRSKKRKGKGTKFETNPLQPSIKREKH